MLFNATHLKRLVQVSSTLPAVAFLKPLGTVYHGTFYYQPAPLLSTPGRLCKYPPAVIGFLLASKRKV
jgi:hypothetical protein